MFIGKSYFSIKRGVISVGHATLDNQFVCPRQSRASRQLDGLKRFYPWKIQLFWPEIYRYTVSSLPKNFYTSECKKRYLALQNYVIRYKAYNVRKLRLQSSWTRHSTGNYLLSLEIHKEVTTLKDSVKVAAPFCCHLFSSHKEGAFES